MNAPSDSIDIAIIGSGFAGLCMAIKLKQALDSVSNVRERSKPVVDATETYIGGHPWQTVAISAGFGLVVGLLLGRRN